MTENAIPWDQWRSLPRISGIYHILHLASGREYIGSARDIHHRAGVHTREMARGKHHSLPLARSFRRHGPSAFAFEIIETVSSQAELIAREQFHIDTRRPVFNVAPVAGSCAGVIHTPSTRRKRSIATCKVWASRTEKEKEEWGERSKAALKAWWDRASPEQRKAKSKQASMAARRRLDAMTAEERERFRLQMVAASRIAVSKQKNSLDEIALRVDRLLAGQRAWRKNNPEAKASMTAKMTATKRAFLPEKKAEILAKFRATLESRKEMVRARGERHKLWHAARRAERQAARI